MSVERLKAAIKTIPDYPKPGIQFRDVTSLMQDPEAFSLSLDLLVEQYGNRGFTKVVGAEARGFIFAAPLALRMGIGFIPVRKPNKLPRKTLSEDYQLEYGTDSLEIHIDAVEPGDKVLMIDDLLATGGTMLASANLIRQLGGIVEHAGFVVSLPDLGGHDKLDQAGIAAHALCHFEGE